MARLAWCCSSCLWAPAAPVHLFQLTMARLDLIPFLYQVYIRLAASWGTQLSAGQSIWPTIRPLSHSPLLWGGLYECNCFITYQILRLLNSSCQWHRLARYIVRRVSTLESHPVLSIATIPVLDALVITSSLGCTHYFVHLLAQHFYFS